MTLRMKALRHAAMLALAAIAALSLAACDAASPDATHSAATPTPTGPIAVVASLNQWASLARQIGGTDVKVVSILPPDTPAAQGFAPSAANIDALRHADIIVANGAGYDDWAAKNLSKGGAIVSAAETVGAMDGDNPYLWFSKDARAGMASELAEAFSKARPTKKKAFAARLKTWSGAEGKLDDEFAAFAKAHKNSTYASLDASAFYLMADLGLKDRTPQSYAQSALAAAGTQPQTDAAPSVDSSSGVKDFRKLLEGKQVDVLIGNGRKPDETAAALLASAKTGKVPIVDVPEQMPAGASSLVDWVSSLASPVIAAVRAGDASGNTPDGTGNPDNTGSSHSTGASPSSPASTAQSPGSGQDSPAASSSSQGSQSSAPSGK
ncbi:MAG: zinc ABC transporter substrate-binding protein [Bifidobacterium tibiigranuli]|uniref:metal ABC transporter solute-binding protein, Zn/Mn family n=1 Tax=Bifidobacterium tibiigranuli TaxID=2172043 RepID=UPI0026EA7B7E|nr:zinc ABC transporter substrate-binding protein [Bifidobacterium tibiigranuli]MCI1673776.1 zinc ABC transporter substrate-binding protein [Bifidobacterium tibiigranuli]MCI1712025.1 zinc ABC transporter substrate-binding protein [Bifidobacterium tibiigranuli]MCI1834698.1 zinc ABC transporter substrate-binding protein [Bifidobacterium tibiigranuli]